MSAKKDSMTDPKLPWSLLLVDLRPELESVAHVLWHGAKKYGVGNWMQGGEEFLRHVKDARERHYTEHLNGNLFDDETGEPHISHVLACDLFLLRLEVYNKLNDNDWTSD